MCALFPEAEMAAHVAAVRARLGVASEVEAKVVEASTALLREACEAHASLHERARALASRTHRV